MRHMCLVPLTTTIVNLAEILIPALRQLLHKYVVFCSKHCCDGHIGQKKENVKNQKETYVVFCSKHCCDGHIGRKKENAKKEKEMYVVFCSKHCCDGHIGRKSTREQHCILVSFQASQLPCVYTYEEEDTLLRQSTASSCPFRPASCRVRVYIFINLHLIHTSIYTYICIC